MSADEFLRPRPLQLAGGNLVTSNSFVVRRTTHARPHAPEGGLRGDQPWDAWMSGSSLQDREREWLFKLPKLWRVLCQPQHTSTARSYNFPYYFITSVWQMSTYHWRLPGASLMECGGCKDPHKTAPKQNPATFTSLPRLHPPPRTLFLLGLGGFNASLQLTKLSFLLLV